MTKVRLFKNLKKNAQIRYKNMTREDTEISQLALKLLFYSNFSNRLGSLVCPPAQPHVLAVSTENFIDTYHMHGW